MLGFTVALDAFQKSVLFLVTQMRVRMGVTMIEWKIFEDFFVFVFFYLQLLQKTNIDRKRNTQYIQ